MQRNLRTIIIAVIALVVVVFVVRYYAEQASAAASGFTLSGTIEATEVHLASQTGGRVQQVYAAEGDYVQSGEHLIDVYMEAGHVNEKITAPIDGYVLQRLIEPGELASPGAPLMVIANLDTLTLKVYVPEDRYGQVSVGQSYPVTVDSFPGVTFSGTVSTIADQAEFTPRNVQTTDSRQSTVFAVKLNLPPTGGKLKPGMPADVHFPAGH